MKQLILLLTLVFVISCENRQKPESTSLNHIQVIGSHNSYKVEIERPLMQLLIAEDPEATSLDYRHLSLREQLDLGIRGLELDVLYDPVGGQFNNPKGLDILDSRGMETQPFDPNEELLQPGFKVFHIPDIDFRSHCLTFKGCLSDIKLWSQVHPDHLPIIITINPKNSGVDKPGFTQVTPFDQQVLDSLDQEIVSIFSESELITPTMVQGTASSLRAAILNKGWPSLDDSRGRVMVVLDAGKEVTKDYLEGNKVGKPMFVDVDEEHPSAGFFIMNDPIQQERDIKRLVEQGFMVRTRSDANTTEGRTGDMSRAEAAFRSGAQLISTDYYLQELSPNNDFKISFEGASYQRCNPIASTKNCTL